MRCARHPSAETYVRCSKCDTPICGDCMVTGPVGIRCRECGRAHESPLFKPKPAGLLRAGGLGIATGLALGWLMKIILFAGPAAIGYLIGEVVLRAGGRKRGRLMELTAGASAALSAIVWVTPWWLLLTRGLLGFLSWPALYMLIAAFLAVACAVGRVRYL